jgi:hypothetical protein
MKNALCGLSHSRNTKFYFKRDFRPHTHEGRGSSGGKVKTYQVARLTPTVPVLRPNAEP